MACTPFSIVLAVLAPDNKRQVSIGVSRGCHSEEKPFYIINFVLRDKLASGEFQDRVKLFVSVGDTDNEKAQRLIDNGMTMTQLQFLQGPVTNKAKTLKAGTERDAGTEKVIANILNK